MFSFSKGEIVGTNRSDARLLNVFNRRGEGEQREKKNGNRRRKSGFHFSATFARTTYYVYVHASSVGYENGEERVMKKIKIKI